MWKLFLRWPLKQNFVSDNHLRKQRPQRGNKQLRSRPDQHSTVIWAQDGIKPFLSLEGIFVKCIHTPPSAGLPVGPLSGNKRLERGLKETRGESDPSYFDARLETDWDNMIFNPIFVAAANRLTAYYLAGQRSYGLTG